jgi:hypothetical protein
VPQSPDRHHGRNFFFFLKHFPLYRTVGRLIKNLSVPYGTLEGKECV